MLRPAGVIGATALAACRLSFDVAPADGSIDAVPGYYVVAGVVTGSSLAGLVLQNNGADDLVIESAGPFMFPTLIADGQPYAVTILSAPPGQDCLLLNATGNATHVIDDIDISCFVPGTCPPMTLTFTQDTMFTLPAGCTTFEVEARGGGGAAGALNAGDMAANGGSGGRAIKTLIGEAEGTVYQIDVGAGGQCESTAAVSGGYAGGGGGTASGFGDGSPGEGTSPPGGAGGAGSTGSQPGGAGGNGGYGGGGGGGGGDTVLGNSGGGASVFARMTPAAELVIGGGGGAAGAADQNGDVAGRGGNACAGLVGEPGEGAVAGSRSGGGGGGGGCLCAGGCDRAPESTGGAGGTAGTGATCTQAQHGTPGRIVLTFP